MIDVTLERYHTTRLGRSGQRSTYIDHFAKQATDTEAITSRSPSPIVLLCFRTVHIHKSIDILLQEYKERLRLPKSMLDQCEQNPCSNHVRLWPFVPCGSAKNNLR